MAETTVPVASADAEATSSKVTKGVLMVVAFAFLALMLVAPLVSVLVKSLARGWEYYTRAITTANVLSALRVSLIAMAVAVVVNTFFGLVAAWALTKFRFKGQRVLTTLVDIPFSISPVIAGLAFVMTFGRSGWARPIVDFFNAVFGTDVQFVFSVPGVVLATIFVTFPFVVRELLPVMHSQGSDEETAAALMGAKGLTIFRRVTLPKIRGALLYGIVLCAARALGEFGAVYGLSKARGRTFTLPLEIDALYNTGTQDSITAAFAVSSILVILAIVILIVRNVLEARTGQRGAR